jgi:diketogulonate reductase-like aldo/keto reductase
LKTKQIIAFILSLVMCFFLIACGTTEEQTDRVDELVENETLAGSQTDSTDTDIGNKTQENDQTEMAEENSDSEQQEVSEISEGQVFDLENGTVVLNSGYEMPILGIGTFRLSGSEAENSVYWALRDGYRLIDTARIYGNEADVGRGIQRAIEEGFVTREEIFVTTKMWTDDFDNGAEAINASLERLGLDYIDLMILHHSQPSNDVEAYQAMEQAVSEGKLRSIGLSNYYTPEDFDRLVNATSITPALLQNETHPYHQSMEMKEHLRQYGTVMESWFPLGGRGNTQTLFNDEVISGIAQAHGKTSAQIILRWHLQAGNIAIPGSSNEDHIQENFEIFDFELTDEEMEQMTGLDRNERFAGY